MSFFFSSEKTAPHDFTPLLKEKQTVQPLANCTILEAKGQMSLIRKLFRVDLKILIDSDTTLGRKTSSSSNLWDLAGQVKSNLNITHEHGKELAISKGTVSRLVQRNKGQ